MRKTMQLTELKVGESLAQDIHDVQGRLLLKEGTVLIQELIDSLQKKDIDTVYIDIEEKQAAEAEQEEEAALEAMEQNDLDLQALIKTHEEISFEMKRVALRGTYNKAIHDTIQRDLERLIEPYLLSDQRRAIQYFVHMKASHRDYSYESHSINTAVLCALLGRWLSLNPPFIIEAALAGLLHDVGENRIPQNIFKKRGSLTNEEWKLVKTHPEKGAVILARTNWIHPRITLAVLRHHERLDGTGYPTGCPGSEIPLYARMIAVSGSFDALTSNRPYREASSIFYAIADLRDRSFGQLDARITRLLYDKILEYYMEQEVQLSNGNRGTIVMAKKDGIARPLVKSEHQLFDLTEKEAPIILHVEK